MKKSKRTTLRMKKWRTAWIQYMQYTDVQNATHLDDAGFLWWAYESQLLPAVRQPRYCTGCGGLVVLLCNAAFPDGAVWRCTYSYCSRTYSIRGDSWLSKSNLTLKKIAQLTACWCKRRPVSLVVDDSGVTKATVIKIFKKFRRIAEMAYWLDLRAHPLGETGGIAQVDDSHFFSAKYNRGAAMARPELWFFGAVDCLTRRVAMEVCENRGSEVLLSLICCMCVRGCEIWSDQWASYRCLRRYGFVHRTVNHRKNYMDPVTGVHTNQIEGNWGAVKSFLRIKCGKSFSECEWYVQEWCFRRNIGRDFQTCWFTIVNQEKED